MVIQCQLGDGNYHHQSKYVKLVGLRHVHPMPWVIAERRGMCRSCKITEANHSCLWLIRTSPLVASVAILPTWLSSV